MDGSWEIQQVVMRVARCSDRADVPALVDNFRDDAVLEAGGRTVEGRPALLEFFGGGRAAAPTDRERTKHVVTNTLLDTDADGDPVVATSYFQVLRSWGVANWGRYVDRMVRDGDRWRIAHRAVFVDGNIPRPESPQS
jgi:ketosteroid isomerase-like protein